MDLKGKKVLVTGAGGFVAFYLVKELKKRGYLVRGVDVKHPKYEDSVADEFEVLDLRKWDCCLRATQGIEQVYSFASNMGGIGFIGSNKAEIMHDNVLINTHMLEAARQNGIKGYLYASSACVYPRYKLKIPDVAPLKEEDAYPADPDDGYGWEKLYTERMCKHYYEEYGFNTHVVRFHSLYGPLGTYDGGREKSLAALCRKVALSKEEDEIEVWGDGKQTRSFCYIDDCIEGVYKLMQSDHHDPINLGHDKMVSINEMIDIIANIAGKKIKKRYDLSKPQGVRGRNSDNTKIQKVLGWEPKVSLEEGLEITYKWIHEQLVKTGRIN